MAQKQTREWFEWVLTCTPERLGRVNPERSLTAIAPGGGNKEISDTRISDVPWQNLCTSVVVCGTRGDPAYTEREVEALLIRNGKLPQCFTFQGYAAHTKAQADWVVSFVRATTSLDALILSTAEYHLPRFALTVAQSLYVAGVSDIRLLVLPTARPEVVVHSTTSQTVEEELARIEQYQRTGDAASWDVALPYFTR